MIVNWRQSPHDAGSQTGKNSKEQIQPGVSEPQSELGDGQLREILTTF